MTSPISLNGLSSIIEQYDGILMDLWGVIHDGTQLYPGVSECLQQLKKRGTKVLCISNAPRRSHKAIAVLDKLGVPKDCYETVITSGETAYRALEQKEIQPGQNYYFIGPERDADVLNGLGFKAVENILEADFLLNVGFGSEQDTVEDVTDALKEAAKAKLVMLCLNPDLEVIKITGERYACAGVIAQQYEGLGGRVEWFGKPYPAIYELCFKQLKTPKSRLLAIGDGLHTDIAGANRAGVDSLLVTGGILQGKEVFFEADSQPTYISKALTW